MLHLPDKSAVSYSYSKPFLELLTYQVYIHSYRRNLSGDPIQSQDMCSVMIQLIDGRGLNRLTIGLAIASPTSVDGFATKFGKRSIKLGSDGITYQWLEMRGSYRGRVGTFEFIKDPNGVINHRHFRTG